MNGIGYLGGPNGGSGGGLGGLTAVAPLRLTTTSPTTKTIDFLPSLCALASAVLLTDTLAVETSAEMRSATVAQLAAAMVATVVINATGDATADLNALTAAYATAAPTATAPKKVAIRGGFAMGATRPGQLSHLILDLSEAVMTQTANFSDAGPWLRGTGLTIIGGLFRSGLGAAAAGNSTLFGDTNTAGDGPMADATGWTVDNSWDALTANRTLINCANTTFRGATLSGNSTMAQATTCRANVNIESRGRDVFLTGAWGAVVLAGHNAVNLVSYTGSTLTDLTTACAVFSRNAGAAVTINGQWGSFTGGVIQGAVTSSASLRNIEIAYAQSTVNSASSSRCNWRVNRGAVASPHTYSLGTGNNWEITASGTATLTIADAAACPNVEITQQGDGPDIVLAGTCQNSFFNVVMNGTGSYVQVNSGARNNEIEVVSPLAPVYFGTAKIDNIVWWQQYSTSTSGTKRLDSYKGPNRVCYQVTRAGLNALSGSDATVGGLTVPAAGRPVSGLIGNLGADGAGVSDLQASIGRSGDSYEGITTLGSVLMANSFSATLGATVNVINTFAATTEYSVRFVTSGGNLADITNLDNGLVVILCWE